MGLRRQVIAGILLGASLAGFYLYSYPVFAAAFSGLTLTLSVEEQALCAKEGGCIIMTRQVLQAYQQRIDTLVKELKAARSKRCI